jgi:hypothetical protein
MARLIDTKEAAHMQPQLDRYTCPGQISNDSDITALDPI